MKPGKYMFILTIILSCEHVLFSFWMLNYVKSYIQKQECSDSHSQSYSQHSPPTTIQCRVSTYDDLDLRRLVTILPLCS